MHHPPVPDPETLRALFLLDPAITFLNHGSYGACPRPVFEAQQAWQLAMERNPVAFLGRRSAALLAEARAEVAAALGAQADDLAFITNATTGVNIAARSLAALLQPGDEVLGSNHEYGACIATWQQVCAERGAHYRSFEVPLPYRREDVVPRFLAALTPKTRVLFISQISSTTALTFPVDELCAAARERGVLTVVDTAHVPGHLPMNLAATGADFSTGNFHKWLCAPKGAAYLHVRPEHQHRVRPPVISWGALAEAQADQADDGTLGGHTGFDAYTGRTPLERRLLWQGTHDIAAWLSVPAALRFQAEHQWPAVRERCHAMAVALLHRVTARHGTVPLCTDSDFVQMVPIPVPPGDAERLRAALFERYAIEVPVTQHAGQRFVRVAVQGYTTETDLARLESALAELL